MRFIYRFYFPCKNSRKKIAVCLIPFWYQHSAAVGWADDGEPNRQNIPVETLLLTKLSFPIL